jgi:lysophospholipase L1-like esterase
VRRRWALVGGASVFALAVGGVLWWRAERAAPPVSSESIVLLGDSITAAGDWTSLLPNAPVVNAGYAGYTTEQLVPVAARVARRHPTAVFILAGTNDIRDGRTAGWSRSHLERIVEAFRTVSPDTTVVVQTVLPRSDAPDAVRAINAEIDRLAQAQRIEVLDLYTDFDDGSGGLRPAERTDVVHLSAAGYERWAAILSAAIESRDWAPSPRGARPSGGRDRLVGPRG